MTRGLVVAVTAAMLALAGCGDDGGGGGGGTSPEQGATKDAKKAPTLDAAKGAKGEITMCAGKDTSGALTDAIKRFNADQGPDGVKVKKFELAADATEVRNQFIQRAQAKSPDCDVLQSDIIWTAEFAQQGWIMDLSDYANARKDEFIPSTLSSYDYDGKLWGLPQVTGAGLLYRRSDQVADAPATWQELYEEGAANDGFAYQGAPYEGLTCNFVELSSAAGGTILSEDGKKAEFDSPENLKALELMVDGMKSGGAVKASRTFMEEPARMAFESGKATLHAQLELRLRAGQEGQEDQGRRRGLPAAAVRGRRQGRRAGRQRAGRERVHRQPRGLAAVARLLDLGGDAQARRGRVLAAADDAAALRRPGRRRRRCPTPRSCARRSRTRPRGRSPPSTRRSRRRCSRTSTRRSAAR